MIDTKQAYYFCTIYENQSISDAAVVLNVSQPALTKSLRSLEHQLGLELFVRHSRKFQPTDAAKALYPLATRMLTSAKEIEEEAENIKTAKSGSLKIGLGAGAAALIQVEILNHLTETFPTVPAELTSLPFELLHQQLLNGEIDFFVFDSGEYSKFADLSKVSSVLLFNEPVVIVMQNNHPWLTKQQPRSDIFNYPWSTVKVPTRYFADIPDNLIELARKSNQPQYTLSSISDCLSSVLNQNMITFSPLKTALTFQERHPAIKIIEPSHPVRIKFSLYYLSERNQSTVQSEVISWLTSNPAQ